MTTRLRELSDEVKALEAKLREGGGPDKIARQHKQGKLTARERIAGLCDPETRFLEIGLLVAYDEYERQAPAAGVVITASFWLRARWFPASFRSSWRRASSRRQWLHQSDAV